MSDAIHNYEQALRFVFDRVNFERTPACNKQDFKLDRMRRLLELLDNPQSKIPCVHIAGTKGKGSTAVMLAEMLTAAGYRVGLYTSPHVDAFEERMQVAGSRPTGEQLVELVRDVQPAVRQCESDPQPFSPTFFEITTALAWLFFLRQQAQIVVLEVGLGGRLDSTNVCSPVASVITTISRDHTQLLGSSLASIAREKAGIIKRCIPVISGVVGDEACDRIAEVCRELGAELWQLGREFSYEFCSRSRETSDVGDTATKALRPPLPTVAVATPDQSWQQMPLALLGEHQAHNAAVALATIDRLNHSGWTISIDAARLGLARVRWPMRIEVVSHQPTVIIDAAHNWESTAALGRTLEESFSREALNGMISRRILIVSISKDKDAAGMLRQLLPRFDSVILTKFTSNPRAIPPEQLEQLIHGFSDRPCHVVESPSAAWQLAQRIASQRDLICVTGSFFIAAEIRELATSRTS